MGNLSPFYSLLLQSRPYWERGLLCRSNSRLFLAFHCVGGLGFPLHVNKMELVLHLYIFLIMRFLSTFHVSNKAAGHECPPPLSLRCHHCLAQSPPWWCCARTADNHESLLQTASFFHHPVHCALLSVQLVVLWWHHDIANDVSISRARNPSVAVLSAKDCLASQDTRSGQCAQVVQLSGINKGSD